MSDDSSSGGTLGLVSGVAQAAVGYITNAIHASAQRAAGARNENQAMNYFVQGFDSCMNQIVSLANAGKITAHEAYSLCDVLDQEWYQAVQPFQHGAGQAAHPCSNLYIDEGPDSKGGHWGDGTKCDKTCTATCCVGCNVIDVTLRHAKMVFSGQTCASKSSIFHGKCFGGSFNSPPLFSNKYGGQARAEYELTYKPPKVVNPSPATLNIRTGQVTTGASAVSASAQEGTPLVLPSGQVESAQEVATVGVPGDAMSQLTSKTGLFLIGAVVLLTIFGAGAARK